MEEMLMQIIRRRVELNNKNNITSFKVKLNWKGIFEVITYIVGIIMAIFIFLYIIFVAFRNEADGVSKIIVLLIPVLLLVLCEWRLIHLLSDRIIVNGNKVIIKRAFRKKQQLNVTDITSYSNTANNEKGHRFYEISIIFGDNESIEIRNDIYKNYDLLLYYLSKNCKSKDN